MKNQPKLLAVLASAALLTGCASGGGGGEDATPAPYEPRTRTIPGSCGIYAIFDIYGVCTPSREERVTKQFKDWAGVAANAGFLYEYDGTHQIVNYQHGADGNAKPGSFVTSDDSYAIPEYDANRTLVLGGSGKARSSIPTLAGIGQPWMDVVGWDAPEVVANPYALGWNYQSFGVWKQTGRGTSLVARSYGAATPATAVPAAGAATFTGKLAGFYVPPTGPTSLAIADLTVSANFSARSLTFASSGTTITTDRIHASAAPNLNLNGALTYSPGSSSFSGTLTNSAGTMSGSSRGQFYGPAAQELGGIFTVKSPTTVETFTGAYGAKR